jgi:RNA polymerase sigma-70 factor (ECF subfamily)
MQKPVVIDQDACGLENLRPVVAREWTAPLEARTVLGVPRGWDDDNGVAASHERTAGAAVAVMYERYAERIRSFCTRRLDDPHEGADAVQDTFLRAWLALRNGTQVRYPLPWLLTIADNVCVSRFRARGARVVTTALSAEERFEVPEATYATAGLTAALRALPENQRQALLRREVQGYSYDEIGAELGVSRASVAALLHRARLTVAGKLRDAREVAALAPIPAFLRTSFEGGGAGLVAGAAAVAIAVMPLAHPSPALPAPPSHSADAAATVLGAEQAPASTAHAGPSVRAEAHTATETSPAGGTRVEVSRAGDHGELGAARGLEPVPASPVPAEAVPTDEDLATIPASPTEVEPAPDADPPGTARTPGASAGGEEQPEGDAPAGGGRPESKSLTPGQQTKGSRGRSVYAPGQTKPGEADGEPSSAAYGRSENPEKGDRPLPETRGDESTRPEDPSGETVPGAGATRSARAGEEQSSARKNDTEPKAEGEGVDQGQSKEEKDD